MRIIPNVGVIGSQGRFDIPKSVLKLDEGCVVDIFDNDPLPIITFKIASDFSIHMDDMKLHTSVKLVGIVRIACAYDMAIHQVVNVNVTYTSDMIGEQVKTKLCECWVLDVILNNDDIIDDDIVEISYDLKMYKAGGSV